MEYDLIDAVRNNNIELVRYLLDTGADVNMTDEDGYSVLYSAITNHNIPIIDFLISRGVNVNEVTPDGNTILGTATLQSKPYGVDIVTRLLRAGANIYNSILEDVVYIGYPEMVKFLLQHGADVFYKDRYNNNLFHIIIYGHHEFQNIDTEEYRDVIRILINYQDQYGKRLNIDDADGAGNTPLQIAAENDDIDLARVLLEEGADPSLVDLSDPSITHDMRELILYYNIPYVKNAIENTILY